MVGIEIEGLNQIVVISAVVKEDQIGFMHHVDQLAQGVFELVTRHLSEWLLGQ